MNIVLYSHSFLPKIGGRELVVHYLARSFSELGHQVRVLGPSGWSRRDKQLLGYSVHRYPRIIGTHLTDQSFSARLREKEYLLKFLFDTAMWKCDIVHAHTTYPTGYIASCAKQMGKRFPLIITPHGDDIHTIPEIGHGMRLNPMIRPKIDFALQNAEAITVISDSIEASTLKAGANPDKVFSVPNGVDMDRFQKAKTINVREKLGLPDESRLIVTVGNYHVRKGHEVIIDAMPRILSTAPHTRLLIIGKGTEILKPKIEQAGLSDQVILTGTIPFPAYSQEQHEDLLAAIYRASEVYVSAGIEEGSEGLSLALLEAMSAGLPIVATDISGNREITFNNINGFLCEPSNPEKLSNNILKILSNSEVQSSMKVESLEIAGKYRWQEIAKMYLEVYKKTIDRCNKK